MLYAIHQTSEKSTCHENTLVSAHTSAESKQTAIAAKWFAVNTRYKYEKHALKRILNEGIEAYLPLITEYKQYKSKRKKVESLLIPRYLFVKINPKHYSRILAIPGVIHFVRIDKQLQCVKESEILILKQITGEYLPVKAVPTTTNLEAGDEVEITGGRLIGIRGHLVRRHNKDQVVIALSIGMQLEIEVPETLLRKIAVNTRAAI